MGSVKKDHLVRHAAMSISLPRTQWPLRSLAAKKDKDAGCLAKYHTPKARPANAMQRDMTRWLRFGDSRPV